MVKKKQILTYELGKVPWPSESKSQATSSVCHVRFLPLFSTYYMYVCKHFPFPYVCTYGHFIGFLCVQCFWNTRLDSAIVTLGQAGSTVILAAQLSFVNFVLREEFVLMFQTFSRNDPPGKAPLSKRKERKKKTTVRRHVASR